MIATETETTPQNEFDLNRFYDAAISITGNAPEIALFDPQLADVFDTDFFMERARIEEGIGKAKLKPC
jgi:hypothetical protein